MHKLKMIPGNLYVTKNNGNIFHDLKDEQKYINSGEICLVVTHEKYRNNIHPNIIKVIFLINGEVLSKLLIDGNCEFYFEEFHDENK